VNRDGARIVREPRPFRLSLIWIKKATTQVSYVFSMHEDLLSRCREAMRRGADFPTLWHSVIKAHPAVSGVPVQRCEGSRAYLEVPLLRGDWLVVDCDARMVALR
jgi:hypothetical protein